MSFRCRESLLIRNSCFEHMSLTFEISKLYKFYFIFIILLFFFKEKCDLIKPIKEPHSFILPYFAYVTFLATFNC